MPFDRQQLRLERFQAEIGYHAAYTFWNLRGVLAERWAHGPVFGATNETPQQVTLMPFRDGVADQRLQAAYGLRACGVVGEGQDRVKEAREVVSGFIADGLQAFRPKRVVRVTVNLFGLYPVPDIVQARSASVRRSTEPTHSKQSCLTARALGARTSILRSTTSSRTVTVEQVCQ